MKKTAAKGTQKTGYTGAAALHDLVVAFPGYGLYIYNKRNDWRQINTNIPKGLIVFRDGIACKFGSAIGLWFWNLIGGWKQINSADPGMMISADIDGDGTDELIVSFDGYGLYAYDPDKAEALRWTQINTNIPEYMIVKKPSTSTSTTPLPTPPPDPYVDPNYASMTWEQRLDAMLGGWLSADGVINYDSPLCPFKR